MSTTIHIPAIRLGVPYRSVDKLTTTGAEVSQVNSGLIRRDLLGISKATEELGAIPTPLFWFKLANQAVSWLKLQRSFYHLYEGYLPL